MNEKKPHTRNGRTLLTPSDPQPVSIVQRDTPIIFCGPHNGNAVVGNKQQPLGMDGAWFNKAHEAQDLYISELFDYLIPRLENVSFIWGNYSRLVCDINRLPEHAIAETSSEFDHIAIPANQKTVMTDEEQKQRLNEIYWPYHDALSDLIQEKREKFGGVMMIDIHSYSPVWKGKKRDVEISILTFDDHPLSVITDNFIRKESGMNYIPGVPYMPSKRLTNAGRMISARNRLPYFGYEIRNDMINDKAGIKRLGTFFENYTQHLVEHENFQKIMQASNPTSHDHNHGVAESILSSDIPLTDSVLQTT